MGQRGAEKGRPPEGRTARRVADRLDHLARRDAQQILLYGRAGLPEGAEEAGEAPFPLKRSSVFPPVSFRIMMA
nr:MAG TPA: hypothetical protein [Caudoviricetes sp.]